jgi:hypothetical protein
MDRVRWAFGYASLPAWIDEGRRRTVARLRAGVLRPIDAPRKTFSTSEARRSLEERQGHPYVLLEWEQVDPLVRRASGEARRSALALTGQSSGPEIRYFRPASEGETPDLTLPGNLLRGLYVKGSDEVLVNAEQSPREAREAAFHEVRHWLGGDEDEADSFATRHAAPTVMSYRRAPGPSW